MFVIYVREMDTFCLCVQIIKKNGRILKGYPD
jgi:hypothetical protein